MDAALVELVSSSLGIASGLALGLLGIATLSGSGDRPRGGLAFGGFALAWGLQISLGNLASVLSSPGTVTTILLLSLPALFLQPFLLLEFSRAQAGRGRHPWLWGSARFLTGGAAVLSAFVLILQPKLFLRGVVPGETGLIAQWGPLYEVMGVLLFFTFGVAIIGLWWLLQTTPTPRTRRIHATFVAGLGIYIGFTAGHQFGFWGGWLVFFPDFPGARPGYALLFGLLTLLALMIGLAAWSSSRRASVAEMARRDRWVALATLVPLAWGLGEGLLALDLIPRLNTVGLWRTAGVAVMAYGVARWRSFHLQGKIQRWASVTTGTVGATAGGAATYGLVSLGTGGIALPALGALTVTGISLKPSLEMARKLFGLDREPNRVQYEQAVYEQRVDSYRAALEAAMARDTLAEDEPFLASLRERYEITDAEDRILRYYARNAVVVPRTGDVTATYERLRLLGEGGGGRTWLARDRTRDQLVVLKEPLGHGPQEEAQREQALQEARLAAQVRHPHVVRVQEVVEDEGRPIIVMEHVEGGSMADLLRSRGVLPWRDGLAFLHDVLVGLQAIHDRGIVHRDIKPSNLLITEDHRVKIGDFGIAVASSPHDRTRIAEGSREQAGTLSYMAPEVRGGTSEATVASDIYACGAVLHECLHGTPPGQAMPVVASNQVPEPVQRLMAKALATDPSMRYSSAREMAEAIGEVSRA